MTNITKEQLSDFKKIYKEKFWINISDWDAMKKAVKLISLIKDVILPPNIEEIWKK